MKVFKLLLLLAAFTLSLSLQAQKCNANAMFDIEKCHQNNLFLGNPISGFISVKDYACKRNYQYGSVYYKAGFGSHEIHGIIKAAYDNLPSEVDLGIPVTNESVTADGQWKYNDFKNGSIYWHPNLGTYIVHGEIFTKWKSTGKENGYLGYPITTMLITPDGIGKYNHFEHGSIYYHPETGANIIIGIIREKWGQMGWEQSVLGYPTTDEQVVDYINDKGRYSEFQYGAIYWHPDTGVYEIRSDILAKYKANIVSLGFPISDQLTTPDGIGRYNHFENGSIYSHPNYGAFFILTEIFNKWADHGWEKGKYGYPIEDTFVTMIGMNSLYFRQRFVGGELSYISKSKPPF